MLEGFEMPKWVRVDEESTDRYGKFVIEPFERGFGITVGNALRRVLLSSLEGSAITAVRFEGVQHEFSSIPGVMEDITQIVLNLKRVDLRMESREPIAVDFEAEGELDLTAGDLLEVEGVEVLNPEQHILTLTAGATITLELELGWGRGYRPALDNKRPKQALGTVPIDSIFSPVTKVNFRVEDARVGQRTDYDSLVLEVWTDGSLLPEEAVTNAARIIIEHFSIFVAMEEEADEPVALPEGISPELQDMLSQGVGDLELSVRSANCLRSAQIRSVGELVQKQEADMLKYRNFGKKSLDEIKLVLESMGLGFGMTFGGEFTAPASEDSALAAVAPDLPMPDIAVPDIAVPDMPLPDLAPPVAPAPDAPVSEEPGPVGLPTPDIAG